MVDLPARPLLALPDWSSIGTCLDPLIKHGTWLVADRRASVRTGDLVTMRLDLAECDEGEVDAWRAGQGWFRRRAGLRFAKRFAYADADNVAVDMCNPMERMVRPSEMVTVLVRVRAVRPTFGGALLAALDMWVRPGRHDTRLLA